MIRAAVYAGPAPHQREHTAAMLSGFARHGIQAETYRTGLPKADFIVTWGWRTAKAAVARGIQALVMERGYIGDRFAWTSLGWNGLNGRATWADHSDKSSERFDKNFGPLVKEWRQTGNGYALIIGQVPGDMSLDGIDMGAWYIRAAEVMRARGYEVRFRPHPEAERRGIISSVFRECRIDGTLEAALAGAAVVVTMNSNTGVDATLAGVPTIVCDHGAMAWPVAAHGLDADLIKPDRSDWLRGMAWKQFTLDEMASGDAWEHVRQPLCASPSVRRALVIGGAACVWEDIEAALSLSEFDIVIAANDVGAHWAGKLDHWVSLHPEKLSGWIRTRQAKGYVGGFTTWAHKKHASCPVDRAMVDWKGSSGLFAVQVARELGCERIVLCGVPMSSEHAHFFDAAAWSASEVYRQGWIKHRQEISPFVRSMSGWTREIFGPPIAEWLAA